MPIISILNQLRTISTRNCPSSGKIFESVLFYPSSISSRFTGLESATTFLCLYSSLKRSYHTNGEHPENPSSENPSPSSRNWVTNSNSLAWKTPRCPTPMGTQFESSIKKLQPGFQPQDVAHVLQQQTDPELAHDIFRWTALQRNYRHNTQTYQIMIEILFSARRTKPMLKLMEEVMEGACIGSLPLFNTIIGNYCKLRMMGPAISVYKKMQKVPGSKPNLRTYNLLLNALLRRFSSFTVCCVHLRSVKSLYQQMTAAGVDPDIVTLNLLIKAHSKALEMHEALRFFREMGLYGCSPNVYTFNYMIGGFCQKGLSEKALEFYESMVKQGLFPNKGVCSVLVCSLSVDGKLEDGTKVLREMTDRRLVPDFLAYRTLVDELGRIGNEQEAFELLEDLRKKGNMLDQRTYMRLVNVLKRREEERVF